MRTRPDELADGDRARLRELHARIEPDLPQCANRIAERLGASPRRVVEWLTENLLGREDRHELKASPHAMLAAIGTVRDAYGDRIAELYAPDEARRVMRAVDRMFDAELDAVVRNAAGERDRVAALQTLSAGLAHEVRNPLNAAKLQLELLERRLARDTADPRLVEPLASAQQELERLTRLLGEFLAFARPAELDLGEYDVGALVREVVAAEQGGAIDVDAGEPIVARVDAVKLRQVVQNLVRNAIEACGDRGRVAVSVRGDGETLHIRVADDGPGIPEAIRARIFEPFFTTKPSGTGLGMSIVHSMVELHGGTIEIDSSARGTRCDVALPRR